MRRLAAVLPLFFAAVLMMTLSYPAEAKRMGGGSTLGKQYSVPKRDTTTSTTSTTTPRQDSITSTPPRPTGASRWLGPLAGLAAGGLLAALLFGDGFQGFQLFDFLVIAALIFGVMMLFRTMRSRPALQPSGGPALGEAFPERAPASDYSPVATAAASTLQAPAWFNGEDFIKGARVHFIRLQAAWDKGDMKDIATYTTPELYAELQAQRLASNETNYTEVSYLDAELLGVQRDGDNAVATIKFFGGIKEQQDGETQEFTELWHVIHAWDTPSGDWYVAGIQQEER